jgi:hypothetical protein
MKVTIPFSYFMSEPSLLNQPEITVRNKQGDKVRILCTDGNIPGFPVVGIVEHDNPDDNYTETYTGEGQYVASGESDDDLVVEVDNDAITKKTGVDPLKAAVFASRVFGDTDQYSPEELELISMISLAFAAK